MYSECPNCHAIFRITPEILERANGYVRCGECQTVFEATPIDSDNEAAETEVLSQGELFNEGIAGPLENEQVEISREVESADYEPDVKEEQLELVPERDIEVVADFTRPTSPIVDRPEPGRSRSVWLPVASLLLVFTLVVQVLLANRMSLAQKPGMRPVLESLCAVFRCEVPQRRDASKIVLEKHAVYSHPSVKGALMIEGVMQNEAPFSQPYPVIELRLSDIRGKTVALRRFGPDEYLRLTDDLPQEIPPSSQIPVHLEVLDPGKSALAFEFSFL